MDAKIFSAFCLAAPRSGEGKTTVAAGIMRALVRRGLVTQGFKCGPDYVDPTFHARATGRPACNLDTWLMGRNGARALWSRRAADADVAVCEGVMGLFDSREPGDPAGSTADCAAALGLPVVLVVNARGMAGSLAALVSGFASFRSPGSAEAVRLVGVIADNVGSERHAELLRRVLDEAELPPLLGALPRRETWKLPERQLGLVPAGETDQGGGAGSLDSLLDNLAEAVEAGVDLDRLLELTRVSSPAPLEGPALKAGELRSQARWSDREPERTKQGEPRRRLAVARDAAFLFYYDENERVLAEQGWEIVPFSPLADSGLPLRTDAVYLGGGYPEVFAPQLAANKTLRREIRRFAEQGGEIWAECGGYMYLCRELTDAGGVTHPMCGVIEGAARMGAGLRSLGYRTGRLVGGLPFGLFPDRADPVLRGHEFHWSRISLDRPYPPLYAFMDGRAETEDPGVAFAGVRAGYVHWYWAALEDRDSGCPEARRGQRGSVLLLNGPSSAGKTSLALALQGLLGRTGESALVLSADRFLTACPGGYASVLEGVRETGLPFIEAFHAAVACAARQGARVIVDHVVGEDPAWVADLLRRLAGVPLRCVQVTCAPEVLHRREIGRRDRAPDWPHARRQWASIHVPLPGAITLDTTNCAPDEGAARLLAFWDGSDGDAE